MKVRFDGPGHRLLAFGQTVLRGAIADFDESELASLLAQPHIRVTVDPKTALSRQQVAERPSLNGSRLQWAAYAQSKGVTVREDMSRDDLVEAVTAVDAPPSGGGEPEAQQGEGQPIQTDQKE